MRYPPSRFHRQLRRSRMALFTLMPFALLATTTAGPMAFVQPALRLIYIVAGFSLIIFLHELGHFLVARACSVKCLAFSIGIGPRMFGGGRGAGLSFGNDPYDPETLKKKSHESIEHAAVANTEGAITQSDLPMSAQESRHPRSVGDCDYRISWLPLGGYVRMLGQDDMDPTKVSEDPHAFNQRPIWQRMCIVSAGVIMNIIFAAVCFSIIFSPNIGVDFQPAVIGSVVYDSPAWQKGIRPGYEVTSINHEPYRGFLEFTDVQMASALARHGEAVNYIVKDRNGVEKEYPITPKRADDGGLQTIGVAPMPGLHVRALPDEYSSEELDKNPDPIFQKNKDALKSLRDEDTIIKADGNPLNGDYLKLYEYLQTLNGKPVELTLQHKDGTIRPDPIKLYAKMEPIPGTTYPAVLGIQPSVMLGEPAKNSPGAKAGLKAKDHVLSVGEKSNPTQEEMIAIVSAHPGEELKIRVLRDGQILPLTVTPKLVGNRGMISVPVGQDAQHLTFIPPAPDTELGSLNLLPDATIAAIDGQPISNWHDVYCQLWTKAPDSKVKVTFKNGAAEKDVTLTYSTDDHKAIHERLHYLVGLTLAYEVKTQRATDAWNAVLMGMDHTKKFVLNVYLTLAGLASGNVPPSNLHGIVGITKVGYDVQQRGPVWLWYLLAMVSVNLAVANFLPLPIVDGGLFLLLIVEKIRGKPLSLKVQTAIQTVGVVLLAGLFLFVTYNDITGLLLK